MTLDVLPLWGLFLITVGVVLLSVECGFRYGRYRLQRGSTEREGPVGSMVSATLALLAFLLAFTFSMAASRFEDRRVGVVNEANAIGTAYLRAGYLPDAARDEIRRLLREYLDTRLTLRRLEQVPEILAHSDMIHTRLWTQVEQLAKNDPHSVPVGLLIQSLNDLIDLHTKRVSAGLHSRIPDTIWIVLFVVTVLAMGATGYQEGLGSNNRTPVTFALVMAFAGVIYLISDLDRTHEGYLNVSQRSLIELQKSINLPSEAISR